MRFRAAARLARVPEGSRVLDVGSRDGGLRAYLPPNVQYQGVDIAPEFASEHVIAHDISQGLPFPDAAYDFVFCIEVLEHVPDPWGTFREFRRVLRPGGVLVLSVPNPYHPKELIWYLFGIADRQGHVYSWTVQTMTALARMNGFRREGLGTTYLHPPVPALLPWLSRSNVFRFVRD